MIEHLPVLLVVTPLLAAPLCFDRENAKKKMRAGTGFTTESRRARRKTPRRDL